MFANPTNPGSLTRRQFRIILGATLLLLHSPAPCDGSGRWGPFAGARPLAAALAAALEEGAGHKKTDRTVCLLVGEPGFLGLSTISIKLQPLSLRFSLV